MKKFLITEEEKNRILNMHRRASSNHYLSEALTGIEPVIKVTDEMPMADFLQYLPKGAAGPLDETKKEDFISKAAELLKASKSVILNPSFSKELLKNERFIVIKVGTDATGSELDNTIVANKRLAAAKQLVMDAVTRSGLGLNQSWVESIMIVSDNYTNTNLDKNKQDATKVGDRPYERYIRVTIKALTQRGLTTAEIDEIGNELRAAAAQGILDTDDEDAIKTAICKLQTFSDIEDLDSNIGGLQEWINSHLETHLGVDFVSEQRKGIYACLRRAAQRSGKENNIALSADQITITGLK